jgi:hypothetical protein
MQLLTILSVQQQDLAWVTLLLQACATAHLSVRPPLTVQLPALDAAALAPDWQHFVLLTVFLADTMQLSVSAAAGLPRGGAQPTGHQPWS